MVDQLPVVYFLHGWPGGPQAMMSAVIPALTKSFAKGSTPFIAVFPDGNAKAHSDSEWADSSDGRAMVESWLTKRVIPYVEHKNIRTKDRRAIVGFSMGGYGAAMIALHHPDLFSQVGSLAGYFILDDITGAFQTKEARRAQSPANYLQIANQLTWYLAEGTNDFTIPIRGQAVAWNRSLKAVGAQVTLDQPSNYHDLTFVVHEMPEVVKWLSWPSPVISPAESESTTSTS
jgi:S-formylglutathione hydrolase FrmB